MEVAPMDRKTLDDFSPLVGRAFEVDFGPERVSLVLVEATELASPSAAPRSSFSLLFQGPPDPFLDQRTYSMTEESLGTLEIFLVPVGRVEQGFLYEAVFN
jgi:hypothetical protein